MGVLWMICTCEEKRPHMRCSSRTSMLSCVNKTTAIYGIPEIPTHCVLEVVVGALLQLADQQRQQLLEVPDDHDVLGVLAFHQRLSVETVFGLGGRVEETRELLCEEKEAYRPWREARRARR